MRLSGWPGPWQEEAGRSGLRTAPLMVGWAASFCKGLASPAPPSCLPCPLKALASPSSLSSLLPDSVSHRILGETLLGALERPQ